MREMHFKARKTNEENAMRILQACEYGVLATVDDEGNAYGVPMSYGLIGTTIYFHCAKVGYKVENLAAHPQVTFTVVAHSEPVYAAPHFSAYYESAIVYGTVRLVDDDAERTAVYRNICERLVPDAPEEVEGAIARDGAGALVYALEIQEISGKAAMPRE